nr:MAG TPA: hypothetical protein [Caudoviricetes sp.]
MVQRYPFITRTIIFPIVSKWTHVETGNKK